MQRANPATPPNATHFSQCTGNNYNTALCPIQPIVQRLGEDVFILETVNEKPNLKHFDWNWNVENPFETYKNTPVEFNVKAVWIENQPETLFDFKCFKNFYVNEIGYLNIRLPKLTLQYLQNVVSRMWNVRELTIEADECDLDLTVTDVYNLFSKKLKRLDIPFVNKGWAQDLLKLDVSNLSLKFIIVQSRYLDDLYDFEADDLVKLIEKGCNIGISYLPNDSNDIHIGRARKLFLDRMKPRFRRIDDFWKIGGRVHDETFRFNLRQDGVMKKWRVFCFQKFKKLFTF